MNKYCKVFLILIALFSLGETGCVTHELLENIKSDDSYTEEVKSVLFSQDGEKLVFIGDSHHYIFDMPVELLRSLRSSFRKSLFARFKEFRVNKNNYIVGNITIFLDESASQNDREAAIDAGYVRQLTGPTLDLSLQGMRYRSEGITTKREAYKLHYNYKVTVLEERSSLEKAALTAATPIAALADGTLILIGVPLVILLQVSPH